MKLNRQLIALRTARGMSQEELAEQLQVSRQSVSKWETGASVPSLDKLVELARLFGITLDELVSGEKPEEEEKTPQQPAERLPEDGEVQKKRGTAYTAGIVLLCMSGVLAVLLAVLTGLFGVILVLPLVACGIICLKAKRHPGLWCTWTVLLMLDGYFHYATGLSWSAVFLTFRWEEWMNYTRLAIAWVMLLWRLILIGVTAWKLRNEGSATQKKLILLMVIVLVLHIPVPMKSGMDVEYYNLWGNLLFMKDWLKLGFFTALIVDAVRYHRQKKEEK